jgi:hypothetical protein
MDNFLGIETTELVGYIASVTVLASFLMKKIRTLRVVNSIGCGLFVLYGILLGYSMPIIITNVAIICINMYFLFLVKPISE